MKKLIAIVTAILCVASTGCSSPAASKSTDSMPSESPSSTSETAAPKELEGEIVFLTNSSMTKTEDAGLFRATKDFMSENPKVKVVIESLSGTEALSKFTTSALAGAGPDIIAFDVAAAVDCAAMGLMVPLTDKINEMDSTYLAGPLSAGVYEGNNYSVPWYYNNCALYYNKDILEKVGAKVPTNWAELEDGVKKATEAGYEGIATRLDGYAIFNFFFQNNNPVIDTSGKKPVVTINQESGKEAFNFYAGMHNRYKAFPESMKEAFTWDKAYTPFVQGDCAFFISGDWAYNNIKKLGPDLKFGVAEMPAGKTKATVMGGYALGINVNSKHQDVAWEYIKYLTDKKCDYVLYEVGRIPGRSDIDHAVVLKDNPDFEAFINQAESTVTRPSVVSAKTVDALLTDAFKKVIFDIATPDEALATLEVELNAFIEENYN